ncbi:reverse transcriptase domain-containing protein [Tanacetum coccineum]
MPPRMMTRSVGRPAAASRGGGTGGRAGRGSGRTGSQYSVSGNWNQDGVRSINVNHPGDVRNVIENNDRRGCTYKEFLACNPKEYDGKGGVVVYTRWIKKIESVQDMSGCNDNQKVKYTAGSFVGKALTWWNSQIRTLGQEVAVAQVGDQGRGQGKGRNQNGDAVNDNIQGDVRNVNENNDRRGCTYKEFLTCNPKEYDEKGGAVVYTYWIKKMESIHHLRETPCRTCFNCNRPGHLAKDCRVVPRNVNPINDRNPTARACYECGSTDHIKAAYPRLNQAQRARGNHQNQVVAVNGG